MKDKFMKERGWQTRRGDGYGDEGWRVLGGRARKSGRMRPQAEPDWDRRKSGQ